jgi:hypothetical protein
MGLTSNGATIQQSKSYIKVLSFASAKIPITMNPMQINHSKAPIFSRFMPLD